MLKPNEHHPTTRRRQWSTAVAKIEQLQSWASQRAELILLIAILLMLGVKKIWLGQYVPEFGADGGFYTDIAQNVRDGLGLRTDVSVFHKGFRYFPHPTSVYPLWPLLYGYLARFAPIVWVGVWVPTMLYFVTLVLAYHWASRLDRTPLLPGQLPGFHAGHLIVLIVGLNASFFNATSTPYTEGLGFALLFGMLLRGGKLLERGGVLAGLEWGAWLIAMILTRSQFVVVWIAVVVTLVWSAVVTHEGRWRRTLSLGTLVAVCGVAWWRYARYREAYFTDASFVGYLRFDLARANDVLSQIPVVSQPENFFQFIAERLSSFSIAFGWHSAAYFGTFAAYAFALPVGAVTVSAWLWPRRGQWRQGLRWAREVKHFNQVLVGVMTAGLFFSLHVVLKVYNTPWHFGSRQGFAAAFTVFAAMLFLLRHRRPWPRHIGVILLLLGTYQGYYWAHSRGSRASEDHKEGRQLMAYRHTLVTWLKNEQRRRPGLKVGLLRPEPQRLAWRTPGIGYHWLTDTTNIADIDAMVNELGVSYIIVMHPMEYSRPQFVDNPQFYTDYDEVGRFEDPAYYPDMPQVSIVYAPRDKTGGNRVDAPANSSHADQQLGPRER